MSISLRNVQPEDNEFLFAVYAATRENELAQVDWNAGQKRAHGSAVNADEQGAGNLSRPPSPNRHLRLGAQIG